MSYSFSILFIKTDGSRRIFESIKAFEINHLYFLIHAAIPQIFNLTAELVISVGYEDFCRIPIKEVKEEIKMHPAIAEAKIRKRSV